MYGTFQYDRHRCGRLLCRQQCPLCGSLLLLLCPHCYSIQPGYTSRCRLIYSWLEGWRLHLLHLLILVAGGLRS